MKMPANVCRDRLRLYPDCTAIRVNLDLSPLAVPIESTLRFLWKAVDHLPAYALGIEPDPDLEPFHQDPRFAASVALAQQVAAAPASG